MVVVLVVIRARCDYLLQVSLLAVVVLVVAVVVVVAWVSLQRIVDQGGVLASARDTCHP